MAIDTEVFTLANLARLAASRGQAAFSEFWKDLTEIERIQLQEIGRELGALMHPRPHFQDPVDKARSEFGSLVYIIETKLSPYDARQVFAKWMEALSAKLDKKSGILIRLLTMRPRPNISKLAKQIAKENEATVPPSERRGWDGTSTKTLERMIFRELQIFKLGGGEEE